MGLIRVITTYLFLEDEPQRADAIFLPGSPFAEPAERAARLFQDGFAPVIVPSGNCWIFHRRGEDCLSECDMLSGSLRQSGVPESAIVREDRARHTLDNARLTRAMLDDASVSVRTAIVCCQSFHGRRCLKAYRRFFPNARLLVCPAATRGFDASNWYKTPVGVFKVFTELLKCTGLFFYLISFVKAK